MSLEGQGTSGESKDEEVQPVQASGNQASEGAETRWTLHGVRKALAVKRWERRLEPFEGFGSPPGRF
jgi:hypothetical protein